MTVTWTVPVQQFNFKIAYEPTRNNFRNIVVVNETAAANPKLQQSGIQTWTFTIPG
jgi:hypothetical protein